MGKEQERNSTLWLNIIKAVRTPLGFFTLTLLILQSVLFFITRKAEGTDFRILLIATLIITLILILLVWTLAYKSLTQKEYRITLDKDTLEYKYDVFISSPMAALSDKGFIEERNFTLSIIEQLRQGCGMETIYYAGYAIDSKQKFTPTDIAVLDDLDAISKSKIFILIYPKRLASSVLLEAGIALALGKSCLYLVKNRKHLPFLMRQAEQAFSNVKVYEYQNLEDIKNICKNKKIFQRF